MAKHDRDRKDEDGNILKTSWRTSSWNHSILGFLVWMVYRCTLKHQKCNQCFYRILPVFDEGQKVQLDPLLPQRLVRTSTIMKHDPWECKENLQRLNIIAVISDHSFRITVTSLTACRCYSSHWPLGDSNLGMWSCASITPWSCLHKVDSPR